MISRILTMDGPRYYRKGTPVWALSRKGLRNKSRANKPVEIPMDTSGFALPKPGPHKKAQPKSGRLIESPSQYSRTKQAMWISQNHRCMYEKRGKICGKFMPTPAWGHRHHVGGRGIGGSKRDDRNTVLVCLDCHREIHGGM